MTITAALCRKLSDPIGYQRKLSFFTWSYWSYACDIMVAMLMHRNNKIFVLWEFTAIFTQTLWTNFLLFCPPTWRQWKPPIAIARLSLVRIFVVLKEIRSTYPILWEEGNPWPNVCWLRTLLRMQLELYVIEDKTICFEKICKFIHDILITSCEK